jgi:hypothetical protein
MAIATTCIVFAVKITGVFQKDRQPETFKYIAINNLRMNSLTKRQLVQGFGPSEFWFLEASGTGLRAEPRLEYEAPAHGS